MPLDQLEATDRNDRDKIVAVDLAESGKLTDNLIIRDSPVDVMGEERILN